MISLPNKLNSGTKWVKKSKDSGLFAALNLETNNAAIDMCGIAGILHWGRQKEIGPRLQRMVAVIRHRGPDAQTHRIEPEIGLGFTRLSIVDLAGGAQPMSNEDGTVWVIFNGEIYNHLALRQQLKKAGHIFASDHSDTEVLVHGWEEWGENLPQQLNGMFAWAIWDGRTKQLTLARDRYGIKPLYTARSTDGSLVFGSEIKALFASGLVTPKPSSDGILEYLCQQNNWDGRTCFRDIEEFPPATVKIFTPNRTVEKKYWELEFRRDLKIPYLEAAEEHRRILERVVDRQIAADVPVMGYLSGGIDSSAIISAAYQRDPGVKAYSCLFDLKGVGADHIVDEREYSKTVANHLGIEHINLMLHQEALIESLDPTVAALESPRMGMAYANYLIAARVAQDCKVVLSGTGGDEIHGGYLYRYQMVTLPSPSLFSRAWFRRLLKSTHAARDIYAQALGFPLTASKIKEALTPEFLAGATRYNPKDSIIDRLKACPYKDPRQMVLHTDAQTYLHGLLVLEDKLSMAHSLEARVPLLDNELVDFVGRLPWNYLCDGLTGKRIFRESVKPWVPATIYDKPKMGFGPPDASWYRGTLKPFIGQRLNERRIEQMGIFNPAFVRHILKEHFSQQANHVTFIWSLLSLESWGRQNSFF
jgi:asparagine synthase (glutamine-hydrolysing)